MPFGLFWLFYAVFERSIVKIIRLMLSIAGWLLLLAVLFHGLKKWLFHLAKFSSQSVDTFLHGCYIAYKQCSAVLYGKVCEKKSFFIAMSAKESLMVTKFHYFNACNASFAHKISRE